ncbi:MAG: anthranilate phosphoribosyltransferase [Alphaproteobacteria bacterium]|nr:anthranilate phosphoribosyltransferase [Alphaproteobacteria bacterium]
MVDIKMTLKSLQSGKTLTRDQMKCVVMTVMNGDVPEVQIAAFLSLIAARGETIEEIVGAAQALRDRALKINAPENAVDCCGTGVTGLSTYSVSTAVSLVAAACGVPIAKHGNRAATSKSGTADTLEALGVPLDYPKETIERALKETGFAFLMAPLHHQALRHVAPVRKELGFRTIFNILGPLANPAGTKIQLIGVFDRPHILPIATALKELGTEQAWVVHGSDGMDEITITGETYIAELKDGKITERILTPDDFGLPTSSIENLKGGDPFTNAAALKELLNGAKNAYRDIVLANTAAVLCLADQARTLKEGVTLAARAIDNGYALEILRTYKSYKK